MTDEVGQTLLFIVVFAVMGWFAFGVIWNIRHGNAVLKWMQSGLPALGERTTLRWLGSSAVQMGIAKAKAPFRQIDVLLVLEPRDVPWFWFFTHRSGRRDMVIVRGQLITAPRYEFDLFTPNSWSEREKVGRGETRQWEAEPIAEMNFRAPTVSRALARPMIPALIQAARRVWPTVLRLSARRESPQLVLHVPMPDPRRANAEDFFTALRELAEQMSKG